MTLEMREAISLRRRTREAEKAGGKVAPPRTTQLLEALRAGGANRTLRATSGWARGMTAREIAKEIANEKVNGAWQLRNKEQKKIQQHTLTILQLLKA